MNQAFSSQSVRELIDQQARLNPKQPFLFLPETQELVDFEQLQKQVRAVASELETRGVAKGSSVAYAMSNDGSCVAVLLGIMYGGYRAVAINLVAGRDVIAYVLAHSQTQLVFVQASHTSLIEEALGCETFTSEADESAPATTAQVANDDSLCEKPVTCIVDLSIIKHWAELCAAAGDKPGISKSFEYSVTAKSDALLMYTSGTTGRPKGVTLSHGNLIAGGLNVALGHQLTAKDKALCVLPLYHINGLCVTVMGPLVTGGSLVLPTRFSTSAFWSLVDRYQCTWFSVVPTQIAYLLRDAGRSQEHSSAEESSDSLMGETNCDETEVLPTAAGQGVQHDSTSTGATRAWLRFGRSASAPLSPDVHRAFEKRFGVPLIETMGLTETAAQILSNPLPPAQRKHGSPGVPIGDDVIIVDKQLKSVAAGVEGELLVRGDNVMQRYFRNEAASSDALIDGGWFRTGDLGRKDEDGYVFISGRLKELIIKGGENIAPREIDDALYQHSDVVEAAAFACPCEDFGQRVEAAVTLKVDSTLSESELLHTCVQRVGKFKSPDRIHILAELPKGPSGKIQRARIRELLA